MWLAALISVQNTKFMVIYKETVKSSAPALQSTRIGDQLRESIQHNHYSLSMEKAFLQWVHFFVLCCGPSG
jgi:hypothetical protein